MSEAFTQLPGRRRTNSFPARLQGRPALHRLRPRDRGDADSRGQAMSARLIILDRSFGEGLLTRVMKDEVKAHAAFSKARVEQEKLVQAQPEYGNPMSLTLSR